MAARTRIILQDNTAPSVSPVVQEYSRLVRTSYAAVENASCELLPSEVLDIDGMSGRNYRCLINQIVGGLSDARYLEVGIWKASTLCSALYGNKVKATAIDNWSQWGGPIGECFRNLSTVLTPDITLNIFSDDFQNVDLGSSRFNCYFFDGAHTDKDQREALVLYEKYFDDVFILIVDDWNWDFVRRGTREGLAAANLKIRFSLDIRTTDDDEHPEIAGKGTLWHNGYFVAVVEKEPRLISADVDAAFSAFPAAVDARLLHSEDKSMETRGGNHASTAVPAVSVSAGISDTCCVVVSYGCRWLLDCLESLAAGTPFSRVVLVANYPYEQAPLPSHLINRLNLNIIKQEVNLHHAPGALVGIQAAHFLGEHRAVLCEDDMIFYHKGRLAEFLSQVTAPLSTCTSHYCYRDSIMHDYWANWINFGAVDLDWFCRQEEIFLQLFRQTTVADVMDGNHFANSLYHKQILPTYQVLFQYSLLDMIVHWGGGGVFNSDSTFWVPGNDAAQWCDLKSQKVQRVLRACAEQLLKFGRTLPEWAWQHQAGENRPPQSARPSL